MKTELNITISWSKKKVPEKGIAHIIFKVTNNTGKAIVLTGYKMTSKKVDDPSILSTMNWHPGDPHFNIILWNKDIHEFHWNDVHITDYYNMKEKGRWFTYVQVRYILQDSDDMNISNIANTTIEII